MGGIPLVGRAARTARLSDYLIAEARRAAERPTVAELRERLARRAPVTTRLSPAEAVRREREGR